MRSFVAWKQTLAHLLDQGKSIATRMLYFVEFIERVYEFSESGGVKIFFQANEANLNLIRISKLACDYLRIVSLEKQATKGRHECYRFARLYEAHAEFELCGRHNDVFLAETVGQGVVERCVRAHNGMTRDIGIGQRIFFCKLGIFVDNAFIVGAQIGAVCIAEFFQAADVLRVFLFLYVERANHAHLVLFRFAAGVFKALMQRAGNFIAAHFPENQRGVQPVKERDRMRRNEA